MRFHWRLIQLLIGLALYGLGIAFLLRAGIGMAPWDVLAQGISKQTHLSFGVSVVIVSAFALVAWIPLKQRLGIGTVLNAVLIGLFADLFEPFLAVPSTYPMQLVTFLIGLVIIGVATGIYLACKLGAGPRDGLMVGTSRALGWPLWLVRTIFEGIVLLSGWLMGGQVREGTLIFALTIGYIMQTSMKLFKVPARTKI